MRELKFRAWSLERKCYVDVWEITFDDEGLPGVLSFEYNGLLFKEPAHNFIIEQYTGLKDKNGKEIYEGDIVEYMTCYYGNEKRHRKVVEWGEWYSDDFGEPHNLGYFNLSECMEVIGNMHENPELLSKEEG